MKKENTIFLNHILQSIQYIEEDTKGFTFEKFKSARTIQDAVIRNIEIIGEAAKNISREFMKEHKELPWRDMVSMRDKLAHSYFGVDLDIVWDVVIKDLPGLKRKIKALQELSK